MSKSPKKKTPRIDPRLLARARLDTLFARYASGALDDTQLQGELSALLAEAGHLVVLDALLKRLEATPGAERDRLSGWVAPFKQPEVAAYLWQQAKASLTTPEARRVALELLQALGEDVAPAQAEVSAPPPTKPTSLKVRATPLSEPVPEPRTLEEQAADERWRAFEDADLSGKLELFQSFIPEFADEVESFEMADSIRAELQHGGAPELWAHLVACVERLRREAPELYAGYHAYYIELLLIQAAAANRWEAVPSLLDEFRQLFDADAFFRIVDVLVYYGQAQLLVDLMPGLRPVLDDPDRIDPSATHELNSAVEMSILFDYLGQTPNPRADDEVLQKALAPQGGLTPAWPERVVARFSTTPAWTPADFGGAMDAEQLNRHIDLLFIDFMFDQYRQGVPLSRTELAQRLWYGALRRQMGGTGSRRASAKKKGKALPATPAASPLVPQVKTLGVLSEEPLKFLLPRLYWYGATFELLPAYLHFIARQGLLAGSDLEAALTALQPLARHAHENLARWSEDSWLPEVVATAWSDERLAELILDPAVPLTVAAPPPPLQP